MRRMRGEGLGARGLLDERPLASPVPDLRPFVPSLCLGEIE